MPTFHKAVPTTLALLAFAALAAGCGHETPGGADFDDEPSGGGYSKPGMPQPGGWGPQGGPQGGQAGNAGQVLQALGQAWSQVNTFSAKYELRETKGSEVETAKVTFYFKKPGRYRYEVASHSASIKNGSTSIFDTKKRQITSRLGGALSLVPIKGTLDDSRAKSVRGWTLDQTDYATQLEMLLAPGAQVTLVQGQAVPTLDLQQPPRYGGGVTLMRVALDPQRMLPTSVELVANNQPVYRKRFTAMQVNPNVAADKFNL